MAINYDEVRKKAGNTNEALGIKPATDANGISTSKDNLMNYAEGGMYAGSGKSSSRGSSSRSSLGNYDYTSQIEDLKKAQLSQSMSTLDKQRNSSISNLSAEKATIEPSYQKAKTQAGVTAKQTARSFDEYMAQRGGSKSGISGQGTLLNNVAYQGAMGKLNEAESSAIADNARRVTDVNNAYESDLVGARAGIEAQALQNYINQMNLDRTYNQQNYQFDTSTGMQRDQFNQNLALQQAGLTGTYNGQQTLQAKSTQQDQEYRLANLNLQQQAQTWQQQFQEQGFTADQAYKAAQLKMAQEQMNLDEKYRYTALNRSGSGSISPNITALKYAQEQDSKIATADAFQRLNELANAGKTRSQILNAYKDNYAEYSDNNVNMGELWKLIDQSFQWDG